MGCRLWGRTESDTTEATEQQQQEQYRLISPFLLAFYIMCFLSLMAQKRTCISFPF